MSLEEAVLTIISRGYSNPRRVYNLIKFSHPKASKIKVYDIVLMEKEKSNKKGFLINDKVD